MLHVRRALSSVRGRPTPPRVEPRGLIRPATQLPTAASSRSFASASVGPKAASKWPKRLLLTTAVVGIASYLCRMPPEAKEQRRLLILGGESVKKGDIEQATRYFSESFAAAEGLYTPATTIQTACTYAALCESLGQHEAALPFYQTAMKNLKAVNPVSVRCVDGVKLLDRTAQCYHHVDQLETAEKMFKHAIRLYEKYHDEFSASPANDRIVSTLDGNIVQVFLHYAQLLASMERDSEVSLIRQRLVELVHSSPFLVERNTLDQFDDLLTLHGIREERRRGREEGRHT